MSVKYPPHDEYIARKPPPNPEMVRLSDLNTTRRMWPSDVICLGGKFSGPAQYLPINSNEFS